MQKFVKRALRNDANARSGHGRKVACRGLLKVKRCFLCAVVSAAASALFAAPTELKLRFENGRKSNYNGNTRIDVGGAAGADFVVSCTRTGRCETAWGIYSEKIPVPSGSAGYAFSFEILSDAGWKNPETSGATWDNAVNWYGSDGKVVARRRLNLEFRKREESRFRFAGEIPEGALEVKVQFGTDGPNILPGEKFCVKKSSIAFYRSGEAVPTELAPDLFAPLVKSRFKSPSADAHLRVSYEISDSSPVDWRSLAVTDMVAKAAVPFVRKGNLVTLAPTAPWRDGLNLIDVAVRDIRGNATVSRKAFFIGETPCVRRIALRDDGVALVDGKPFFPVGMYAVSPYEFNGFSFDKALGDLKAAGFNFVHSYAHRFDPALFAAAEKYGMMQWTTGHGAYDLKYSGWFAAKGRADRTVLSWYIGDDTSMYMQPGELFDRDEAVKMVDPWRITCQADGVRATAAKSNYQHYLNHTDVFLPELYPIDGFKDERCVAEICLAMDRCREDIRRYGDGRPKALWPILQCFHGKGWRRYPTAAEMYAMSFAALVHGGNGITWFKYGADIGEQKATYSGMFRTQEDWTAMTNIARRISSLAPVFLERTPPQPQPPLVVDGPKVDPLGQVAVTMLLKRCGGFVYIIAVNAANEPVRARFMLKGFVPERAKGSVAWEKRQVKIASGVFEDSFDAFGVHVYRFSGSAEGQ